MKIAYIATMGIPARYGGFETCVQEVSTRLAKEGHEIIVYCGYRGSKPKMKAYKGVTLVQIPCIKNKFLDFPFRALLSTIDVLHRKVQVAHFYGSDAWPYTLLTRFFSIKTVLTLDGMVWKRSSYPKLIRQILLYTAGFAFYFPNKVIVDSKHVQRWYKVNAKKKPLYLPYGANIDARKPDKDILKKRDLENQKYILFVGRLVREKGVHYLIEAFKNIKTDYKLVIVGNDPYGTEYESFLRNNANENVIFLGQIYGEECNTLYKGAYLYVSPSDLEGTSPALLTAMAFGRCVLVSDIPENLETIDDAGIFFNQGDPHDLAQKLELLLTNPDIVKRLSFKATERIKQNYSWEDISKQTENLYKSLLKRQPM